MAGYSGTPLPQKLGLKPGARLGLLEAPADFAHTLGALPEGVAIANAARSGGPFDVIVAFFRTRIALGKSLPALQVKLQPAGGLWIAWPKKSAPKASPAVPKKAGRPSDACAVDLSESEVRQLGLASGLVDNKVCAIDEVWSGLRFVVRLVDRAPPPAPKRR